MIHKTYCAKTYPHGAERWVCPTCGREVIFQFPPLNPKNIVLVKGDSTVSHTGSKEIAGLKIAGLQADDEPFVDPDLRDQINDALEGL